jgi:hypothetical protein
MLDYEQKIRLITKKQKTMLPYLLAIAGGYLIGNSMKDDGGIMAKGGNVEYYDKDNEYRLGRPMSPYIEKEILEKVKYYAESENFVGNFGWKLDKNSSSRQSIADGYLYKLDDYDESLVKNIKLKQGENIFRYFNRTTAIGGMTPLIKINLDKGLLYFPKEERDKVFFDAKGVKALWINIIQYKL